jgi:hypothetical protein
MPPRSSPAVYRSRDLDDFLRDLEPDHRFRRWMADMEAVLRENMFAGDAVRKRLIPAYYVERYGVNNLYRYAHPEGYRSCYTLVRIESVGVCPVILDLLSHQEYDRVFGYRAT